MTPPGLGVGGPGGEERPLKADPAEEQALSVWVRGPAPPSPGMLLC